jgi:hypothetical protein
MPLLFDRKIVCNHIIAYNPLGSNELEVKERINRTIQMYEQVFDQPAPVRFWEDGDANNVDNLNDTNDGSVRKRLMADDSSGGCFEEDLENIEGNKDGREVINLAEEESSEEESEQGFNEKFLIYTVSKRTSIYIIDTNKCSHTDKAYVVIKALLENDYYEIMVCLYVWMYLYMYIHILM